MTGRALVEQLLSKGHTVRAIVRSPSKLPTKVLDHPNATVIQSPTTGIFTGRPTARANVAHFMIDLVENAELWSTWRFGMPVIMNS